MPSQKELKLGFIGLSKPEQQRVFPSLMVGDKAPPLKEFPSNSDSQLIAFLRHPGCPFAEHTVKQLVKWKQKNQTVDVFIVSHGDEKEISKWLQNIGGHQGLVSVIDPQRTLYGKWGVGYSHLTHFIGPASLIGVFSLFLKGVRNRSATGTRWQKAGIFLISKGIVTWKHNPRSAQELILPQNKVTN